MCASGIRTVTMTYYIRSQRLISISVNNLFFINITSTQFELVCGSLLENWTACGHKACKTNEVCVEPFSRERMKLFDLPKSINVDRFQFRLFFSHVSLNES